MASGRKSNNTESYKRDYDAGYSAAEIARRHGVKSHSVYAWAARQGLRFGAERLRLPKPGGTVDNALTSAFREVFGWCPFRDGIKYNGKKPLRKAEVEISEIDRMVPERLIRSITGKEDWEADEVTTLLSLKLKGLKDRQIAWVLGRTLASTKAGLHRYAGAAK